MKNYYEILEISENASQEIVEKAYKTLAKKYHPDLQQGDLKKEYEEKLKTINEAYEVLSNIDRRKEYNQVLAVARKKAEEQTGVTNNQIYKSNSNNEQGNNNSNTINKIAEILAEKIQENQENAVKQATQKQEEALK